MLHFGLSCSHQQLHLQQPQSDFCHRNILATAQIGLIMCLLDTAGPVNIHASVQQAMDRPAQNHRDPWFNPFFSSILEDSKMLFGTTTATTFIYPGTGTGGWEVGLTNTLSPGDKILTFRYGQFSLLWVDMMERLGLDVQVIDERWGNGVNEERLEKVSQALS